MKYNYTWTLSLGLVLSCPTLAEPMSAQPQDYGVADNKPEVKDGMGLDSCTFKRKNLPEDEFHGVEIPQRSSFSVPPGYSRLVFEGQDGYLLGHRCRLVIDVSHVGQCGQKIWEILYEGSWAQTFYGGVGIESVDPSPGTAFEIWDPIHSKYFPQQAILHVFKPGITFRDLPSGGILSFKGQTKFYGESLVTLDSFEHERPLFPAAKSLVKCTHLELKDQSEFDPFPYYEGIPRN